MIAIIAACARNGVIGEQGHIPWHIPGEQRRFRQLTMGHVVVMGRRTFADIGHALPGRTTVVLTRSAEFSAPGVEIAHSLPEALERHAGEDVFIAGGAALYREALPFTEVLYLTEIDADIPGDTFFPEFEAEAYLREEEPWVEGALRYRYVTYRRR